LRCAAALCLAARAAAAQFPANETHKLVPGGTGDQSGEAIALCGDVLAVGSPGDNAVGPNAGSVAIYERDGSGWTLAQVVYAPDASGQPEFGERIDCDGTTIAVSATPFSSGLPGKAWAVTHDGVEWVVDELPTPGNLSSQSLFGQSVAVDGDRIVVGDRGFDWGVGENIGAVFVFDRVAGSWIHTGTVGAVGFASDTAAGYDVDLDGNTMAVGTFAERVLIYERDGGPWILTDVLLSDDPGDDAYFGSVVSLSGDLLAVGAEHDTVAVAETGSATVFRRVCGTFEREAILVSPSVNDGDRFGDDVAIHGNVLVVGATFEAIPGFSQAGTATVYRYDGFDWQYEQQLTAAAPSTIAYFGFAVDVQGDEIVVGSRLDDEGGLSAGAAYVYEGVPVYDPWADLGQGLAGSGGVPELVGAGSLAPHTPMELRLSCAVPLGGVSIVLGVSALVAPFKGGTLVPDPVLIVSGLGADTDGGLSVPAAWPAGVPSGPTIYVQAWMSDVGGPVGFTASNGVSGTTPEGHHAAAITGEADRAEDPSGHAVAA
jgi:hypothetical protein